MTYECACGCGNKFTPSRASEWRIKTGKSPGFIAGHHFRGARNPRWNGGQASTAHGYVLVQAPIDHPNARSSGYILEHRLIMERHIGRPLMDSEIVHHINENKSDNRVENLQITNRVEHGAHHKVEPWSEPKICPTCGKAFIKKWNHARDTFCSRKCIKGVMRKGEGHHAAKLNATLVREIRRRADAGESHQSIADSLGIVRRNVSRVAARERWAHVE